MPPWVTINHPLESYRVTGHDHKIVKSNDDFELITWLVIK